MYTMDLAPGLGAEQRPEEFGNHTFFSAAPNCIWFIHAVISEALCP